MSGDQNKLQTRHKNSDKRVVNTNIFDCLNDDVDRILFTISLVVDLHLVQVPMYNTLKVGSTQWAFIAQNGMEIVRKSTVFFTNFNNGNL